MDLVSLKISDKKHRRVGDTLVFKGRAFRIIALSAELIRGEFVYAYTLAEESYIYSREKPSPLKGLSLEGRVIERSGETVKLHLDIDKSQDKEKAHFYPYAPITGRAMYSMPIVGEKVRLSRFISSSVNFLLAIRYSSNPDQTYFNAYLN